MKIIDAVLGFFKPTVVEKKREVKVVRLDAVDSTNAYLRTYTPAEDEPMTVVVADYQTAGKGRGRTLGRVKQVRTCCSQCLYTRRCCLFVVSSYSLKLVLWL